MGGELVDAPNLSNNYVIIDVDSMTANDIYKETINYIKLYQSYPEFSMVSNIENQFIRFNTYCKGAFVLKQQFMGKTHTCTYNIRYTNEINIRDGKVKVAFINLAVDIDYSATGKNCSVPFVGRLADWAIFNKNGEEISYTKVGMDNPKSYIEKYFNDQVKSFITSIKHENFIDNW